jgi:hypothetical protein
LRKTIYIALIIGFLISCGNDKALSEIEKYVTEINTRNDLSESITEFNTEDLNGEIVGGISIYKLTDEKEKIYRIIAEVGKPNQSPAHYEFYFKKYSLTFARIVEFNETGNDTIVNSEYYYDGIKLVKQIDLKKEKIDAETVRQASQFYLVYGKDKTEFKKNRFDKAMLFGVWDSTKGGDADFRITENDFYLVDFFERSEYKINGNLIKIIGSDYYENGLILKVSEDSLKIKWVELDVIVDYWKFNK